MLEKHRERMEGRLAGFRSVISSIGRLNERKETGMENKVETKELGDQPIVGIRLTSSMADIGMNTGNSYGTIFGYLGKTGSPPAGPPFTLYYDEEMKEEGFDMEVVVPVAAELPGEGDVKGRVLQGGKFVSTMHMGPYEEIGSAYERLLAWARENGFEPTVPSREVYLVGPDNPEANPSEYRTEVLIPVR